MSDAVLSCKNIQKRFSSKEILKNINLDIYPGMVVGLLGKNGAGKSTLLRTILGLVEADSGLVNCFNQPSQQLSVQSKSQIGFVPQECIGYEGFSVETALQLHKQFYPNWDNEFEAQLLSKFELSSKAKVTDLSVGQRQSLALIMAMSYHPKLLILDEPVASLDPIARRTFMADLFELALDNEAAVLFSSHITSDIEKVASHIAVLKDGEIQLFDELEYVKENIKLVTSSDTLKLGDGVTVLNQQSHNRALIYTQDESLISSDYVQQSLNLEQLFVEIHA